MTTTPENVFDSASLSSDDGDERTSEALSSDAAREQSQDYDQSDPSSPLVSITVPTYNNVDTIAQCVESLASQEYRPVEVIVVDDGSTDGTSDAVKPLLNRYANVHLVRIEHSGPSHARNVGTSKSAGDVYLFADGDAVYSCDYLKKSVALLRADPGMGAVCVTGTTWIQKSTFVSRGIGLEFEMKQRFLRTGKWKAYFAYVYTRTAIEQVGGFDEKLFQGEDKDLFHRVKNAGFHIGLVQGFNWFHRYPQDMRSLMSRSYRGGKQRVIYVAKRRMYGEVLKRTAGLWGLLVLIAVAPFVPDGYLLLASVLTLVYSYKLTFSLRNGWRKGKFSDFLLLPVMSAVRYLTTAAGYSKGSLVYLLRTMRHLETGWADV